MEGLAPRQAPPGAECVRLGPFFTGGPDMQPISRRRFLFSGALLAGSPFAPPAAVPLQRAPAEDRLLSRAFDPAALLPAEEWRPFPAAADRSAWERLPEEIPRRLTERGETHLGGVWQPLPATLFLEFRRNGNRSNYERVRNGRREQLASLVLAECARGEGRCLEDIANGIWTTCEETFWGVPAHLNMQQAGPGLPDVAEPVVDLFAAETASLLAWTDYLLGERLDAVSPLVRRRIRLEVDRRILSPCLARSDFWWMGLDPAGDRRLNNWTPWIVSNWLASSLLLESDPERRAASVRKCLRCLDLFLASYHPDGGCDEGPGYWSRAGGSLFDCLELLHSATRGSMDFYSTPLIREIGRYIYRAHIHGSYFINFADASAKLRIAGDLVFRFGRRIGDARMQALGAYTAEKEDWLPGPGDSIARQLAALFNLATLREGPRAQPLPRDVWLPGIQVMAARVREGSAEGLYLAAQGGHNAESHNHNDVGNFIVYAGGLPAVIDVGVETYTAKTFSARRYEIWTMQSAYHNLPTIGGVMQRAGLQFAARDVRYHSDDRAAELSLEIAGAFPPEAGLDSWKRVLRLDRAQNRIEVRDAYILKKRAAPIVQSLMTPCRVSQTASGELTLEIETSSPARVKVLFDPAVFEASIEEIPLEDARLRGAWGERLYRILLSAESPKLRDTWTLGFLQTGS